MDRDQGGDGVIGFRRDSATGIMLSMVLSGSDFTLRTGIRVSMVLSGSDLTLWTRIRVSMVLSGSDLTL